MSTSQGSQSELCQEGLIYIVCFFPQWVFDSCHIFLAISVETAIFVILQDYSKELTIVG